MLGNLARVIRKHSSYRHCYDVIFRKRLLPTGNLLFEKYNSVSAYQHSLRYLPHEDETLSYKVLEHFRGNALYSALPISQEDLKVTPVTNANDEKYAIKRLLLVIAHNPEVKADDILRLFSLFVSSQLPVLQQLISDKVLLKDISARVMDSLCMMNVRELQQLATSLKKLKNQRVEFLHRIINNIATQCDTRAKEADLSHALQLFDVLMILYENRIPKRREFDTFMSIFETKVNVAQPHELVQILHYIGIGKTKKLSKEFAEKAMKKLEPDFNSLNFCDVGIAAAGIFKSGVALDTSSAFVTKTARCFAVRMKEHSVLSDLESYALVSMIKLLRVARYEDAGILSGLSKFILGSSDTNFTPQVIPHILSFYANLRIYEENIFTKLERLIHEQFQQESSSVRVRDIARLMWCFSYTGHECSSDFLTLIEKMLLSYANGPVITKHSHYLSDSLLSLAICKRYPEELIKKVFNPAMIEGLKGKS